MPISLVTHGGYWVNSFSATRSISITTSGANRALLVLVGLDGTSGGTTIDSCAITAGGSASLTDAGASVAVGAGPSYIRGFYLSGDANVPSGSITITGTCSNANHKPWIVVAQYSGVASVASPGSGHASNRSPAVTVVGTVAGNKAAILGCISYDASYTMAPSGTATSEFAASGSQPELIGGTTVAYDFLLDQDGANATVQGSISNGSNPDWGAFGFDLSPAVSNVVVLPSATQSAGAFSAVGAASIHAALNDGSDSTYAQATAPTVFVVKLADVTNPQTNSGLSVKFRAVSSSLSMFKMALYDGDPGAGGTKIAEWTDTLTASIADYVHNLTTGEAGAITGTSFYGNLYLRGEAL